MAFFALLLILCILSTQGAAGHGLFFHDDSDTFMDHYNSMVYNEIDPYENKVIYPPLASLTYRLCLQLVPKDDYRTVVSDPTQKAQPRNIRIGQSFTFQYILFWGAALTLFFVSVDCLKKGKQSEKAAFTLLFLLSAPFLFMLERGNNILLPLAFSAFFLAFYDARNPFLREFALISLAVAAGYKIYPLVFCVLLLRGRQYRELLRTGLYCAVTLILPFFLFYDGFTSMKLMLTNIAGFGNKRSSAANLDAQLDFQRIFYFLYTGTQKVTGITISEARVDQYASLFRYLLTGICLAGTLFLRKRWKTVMLCAMILYGYPGSCATYLLVFMMLGVILFLDEERERSVRNVLYLVLMTLTQIPLIIGAGSSWTRYWPTKITSLAVLALVLLTAFDLFSGAISWNERRKRGGIRLSDAIWCGFVDFWPEKAMRRFYEKNPGLAEAGRISDFSLISGCAAESREEGAVS